MAANGNQNYDQKVMGSINIRLVRGGEYQAIEIGGGDGDGDGCDSINKWKVSGGGREAVTGSHQRKWRRRNGGETWRGEKRQQWQQLASKSLAAMAA